MTARVHPLPALLAACLACWLAATPASAGSSTDWIRYDPCSLDTEKYFDGDSFHVRASTGYTYVFRIYFADCPETDRQIPERVAAQSLYFGVSEEAVLRWGRRAKEHAAKFLSKPFTALTRKEKALGQSAKARYYALISRGETDLAEELVANGLARAYGEDVELPDGTAARRNARHFRQVEANARTARKGIWGESRFAPPGSGLERLRSLRDASPTPTP